VTGDVAERLRDHVRHLAYAIGPRNLQQYAGLQLAEHYIRSKFAQAGYSPARQAFPAYGRDVANIEAERPAPVAASIVVVGAHYDTVSGCPGADDNASGVAVLLELAREYASRVPVRATVRFVAFVNEEPPHFRTDTMGSLVYAREAASRGDRIEAMLSLESMGYYSDEAGSQQYPPPFSLFFPDRGNFLAMVSNFRSTSLLLTARAAFKSATSLPVIASPAPEGIAGVSWSDHWSFWRQGVRAIMLTDTVPFRNPHYHTPGDTPDTLDYRRLADAFAGCLGIVDRLASK
jgi:Zn-dependent M28 family amino/carboxypeptidase